MQIKELRMQHFRNYEETTLSFTDGVNVFVGENAQGKTNALEAIYLLAIGKSHRTHRDQEIIQWGHDASRVTAVVSLHQRNYELQMDLKTNGKRALVNGVSQNKMTDFIGHFQVVLFAPEDLQLVKGGPAIRRRFIDTELAQTQPKYLHHLGQYQRALQQRNALLKQKDVDWSFVEVFDDQLVEHGLEILKRRIYFLKWIQETAVDIYERISNHREKYTVDYVFTIPGLKSIQADQDEIESLYRKAMVTKRDSDHHMGYTTVGPHRDDVTMFLDGQPVHAFGSQGQQRSAALALRLSEIEFILKETGEYPVLLLDDVLSELDDSRQKNLVLSMSERVQTIVTTTSLFQLQDRLKGQARLFHVHSGIIQNEGKV
jgi:DNA replication and repair protein RecF